MGVYLQFVGTNSKYYTPKTFVEEALNYGFNRIVPFPIPVGSLIAFATSKVATAEIYAIGVVDGWTVMPKTESASKAWKSWIEELKWRGLIVDGNDGGNRTERRRCGVFTVSATYIVNKCDQNDLLEYFKEFLKQWNEENDEKVTIHDFKWMVRGKLVWYAKDDGQRIKVEGIPFTRSLVKLDEDDARLLAVNGISPVEVTIRVVERYTKSQRELESLNLSLIDAFLMN